MDRGGARSKLNIQIITTESYWDSVAFDGEEKL
jgi:hypothetical protein